MGTELDLNGRFRVAGRAGAAFYVRGYATSTEYEGDYLVCDDEECDHQLSEMCWTEGDYSLVVDYDHVRAVMVGDDREHIVGMEDLIPIVACLATGMG